VQEENVYQTAVITSLVLLLGLAPAGHAQAADPDGEDTMVVVDRDTLPEDIVNVIRLPVPAREAGGSAAGAARIDPGSQVGEVAREAAAELAGQARAGGAEAGHDAREAAADLAESLRDAARDAREDQTGRGGPPIDIELPDPVPPRP
jgi:hypothetical protein